jgi:capsular exopolysaccharide synthesis family protein
MENKGINSATFGEFITFSEILSKIRRRKWTLVICIVLSLLLVLLYNHMATPIYRASAIISFEQLNKDSMLELDFASSRYKDNFIANRMMEIKTWTFAENVFRAIPDSLRQLFPLPDPAPIDFDPESYFIAKIQSNLSVVQNESAPNLLTISFDLENGELAKEIANTAITMLKSTNLSYRREEFASLKKFIDQQLTVVKQKLAAAEDTLSQFKDNHNIASLEIESREILTRITQAEILYNQIQSQKKAEQRKLSVIQQKIAEQKKNIIGTSSETSNPMIAKLKEQLIQYEVASANLQVQGYAADHPRQQELNKEIERVKQSLVKLTMGVIEDQNLKGMIDPLSSIKNYLEESVALEIEIEALLAQQGHLEETLQSYNKRLKSLSANDVTLFDLLRDREVNNKLYVRLLEEREQARLREAAEIGNMREIEQAKTPLIPYTPKKKLNIFIAFFAGSAIGLLLIFLRDSLSDAPQEQEDVELILDLPVLASIPKVKRKWTVSLNGTSTPEDHTVQLYRDSFSYLWNCVQAAAGNKINSVLITSATPGEGKSTISINLAITAANFGRETLLIEGDLRRQSLTKLLNVSDSSGLSNFVSGDKRLQAWDLPVEGLKFLSAGTSAIKPGMFWNTQQVVETIRSLKQDFDFVVIDSPPVLGMPDAVGMAPLVDAIILCVGVDQADKTFLLRTRKILRQTNTPVVGIVWNKVAPPNIYGKYKYQNYYEGAG